MFRSKQNFFDSIVFNYQVVRAFKVNFEHNLFISGYLNLLNYPF
jgi:hypothetical protein